MRGLREDVTRGHVEIEDALGIHARPWYRLPYGAGAEEPHISRRLARLGYQHVGWDVDVKDFAITDRHALVPLVEEALAEANGRCHPLPSCSCIRGRLRRRRRCPSCVGSCSSTAKVP